MAGYTRNKADNAKKDLDIATDIVSRTNAAYPDAYPKDRQAIKQPIEDYDHNMTHRPPVIGPSDYED